MKNEDMSLPTPEQIRAMIKNLHEWGKNTEAQIPLHDANALANLVVRLYGFSSWMDYLSEFKKEKKSKKNLLKPQLSNNPKKLDSFTLKKISLAYQDEFFSKTHSVRKTQRYELQSSHDLFSRFVFTRQTDTLMKTQEPVALRNEMAILCGSESENMNDFKLNHLEWLKENHQSFIAFGFSSEQRDKLKGVKKIGQNALSIDPLNECMESDGFELFMGVENMGKNTFLPLWFMMVRFLKEEFNLHWTAEDLMHTLSLSFIVGFINHFNHHFLSQALQQYLSSQCNIQIDNDYYILDNDSQKYHYLQMGEAEEYLKNLATLYHENYFSYQPDISFKELIFSKDRAIVINCEENTLNPVYCRIIHSAYYSALQLHKKELNIYNPKKFIIWSLWSDCSSWITEDIVQAFSKLFRYTHLHAYVHDNSLLLESWFKKARQVIFFKQVSMKYPASWKEHMLNVTQTWDVNMWLNDCHILQQLKPEEILCWMINEEYPVEGLESFSLKYLSLNNHQNEEMDDIPDYP
jgi:hypothetical protein